MNGVCYNEIDCYAAEWLRNLIKAGEIPGGKVDERDIREVRADDIRGFKQVHLFAGIGGWARALQLAGWGDERPCWTGSVPCQPFSDSGDRRGTADPRHLWPELLRLIRECRPECILGEQVPGAVRLGWLDGISTDLEAEDYAVGTTVLGAHSAGAPHIRNRIWWGARRLGDSKSKYNNGEHKEGKESPEPAGRPSILERLADGKLRRISPEPCDVPMADGLSQVMGSRSAAQAPSRTGMLRGYGNAIVPETAAIFVRAWMGSTGVNIK